MNVTRHTKGGAAVYEPSQAEFDQFLDEQISKKLGLSLTIFTERLRAHALDLDDPVVSELAALVQARS